MAKKNRYNLIQYNRAAVDYTPPEPFSASYGILTVIGRDGEPIPVNGYSDFFITHRQDGWDKVNFALPVDLEIYREITEETIVRYADNEYSVKKIKNGRIEGEINLGFLRGIYYEHYELTAKTLSYALSGILPTGWTAVGAVLIPGTITLSLEHSTGADIVNTLMSAFNVYFVWNCAHRTCTVISADTAEDRGQYMTDELNLKQVSYTGSTADFCTVLYCYGRDNESIESVNGGKKYIENHTYSAKRIVGVFTCDYYEPLHIMIAGVREMLRRCKPEQSYECDVVDLAKLSPTYSFLDFSLYQSATLIDSKRKLKVKHRIVEYKEYPDEPERNVVTLSQSAPHYPEIVEKERKKLATEVSSVQKTASDAKVSAAQAQTSADEAKAVADDTKSSLSSYVKTNDLSASIDTYVDSTSGKARIVASLSGTYQTVDGMNGYVKTTQLSADIGAYIDTQAGTAKIVNAVSGTYATQDSLGNYLEKTELDAGITSYIDTQAGKAKVVSACSGTYQRQDAMTGYLQKTELAAEVGAYIDTKSGTAKIVNAVSGTYATQDELGNYLEKTELNAGIESYIDTNNGKAKVVSACSGTYQRQDAMSGYLQKTDLSAEVGAYIDTNAGTAKIVSAVSGTYQTKDGMADYATKDSLDDFLEKTELNAGIETYIDTQAGKAKITSAVSGTYATKDSLTAYLKKTELDAGISSYIDTQAGKAEIVSAVSGTYQTVSGMSSYQTKSGMSDYQTKAGMSDYQTVAGMSSYVTKTNLDSSIGSYIDGTTGKAKVVAACSGTYQKASEMSNYVTTTNLETKIGGYIDGSTGKAKVISACSGTYQTQSGMSDYAKTSALTSIEQSVSDVQADITLSTSYTKNTIGTNVQALIQLVSNPNSSNIKIKADKIDFTGFTTFLKASDLGSSGSTSIDGGRIKTGTISAERIDVSTVKLTDLYITSGSSTYSVLYGSSNDLYIGKYKSGSGSQSVDEIFMHCNKMHIGWGSATSNVVFDMSNSVFRPDSGGYSLGTSAYQWTNLYAKNIYLNGTAITGAGGGMSATDVKKVYCDSSTTNYIGLSSGKDFVASGSGFSLGSSNYPFDELYIGSSSYHLKMSDASIIPNTTVTSTTYFNLGSSTRPFNTLYAKKIYLNGTEISGGGSSSGSDFSGKEVKMGGSSTYHILCNSSRELRPNSTSATCYLGTSSYYWDYAYIGANTVMIGKSASSYSGSKIGFYGTTPIVQQTLSLSSNNMSYTSVTASNYLYALNNLIGILKKHGLISA